MREFYNWRIREYVYSFNSDLPADAVRQVCDIICADLWIRKTQEEGFADKIPELRTL